MMRQPISGSALTNNEAFKVLTIKHGSGWSAVHIAVDQHIAYDGAKGEIVLTVDAENYSDFERQLNILKETLDNLKPQARARFEEIEARRSRL
jgi:type II secretory pathway component PulL